MTTIALTATQIAADSCAVCDEVVVSRSVSKLLERENRVFAICGSNGLLEPLAEWFLNGAKADDAPDGGEDGWTLLAVESRVAKLMTNTCPYPAVIELPYAMGSGGELAMGALLHGATAEEAVRIACARDVWSCEPVQVVDVRSLGLGLREPGLRVVNQKD